MDRAVAELGSQVAATNSEAAAQQHQQNTGNQISHANQQLASDISTLSRTPQLWGTDRTLACDVEPTHSDYGTEQSGYQKKSAMASAPTAQGADEATVDSDLATLQGDTSSLQSDSVGSDLSAIRSDAGIIINLGGIPDPDPPQRSARPRIRAPDPGRITGLHRANRGLTG